MFKKSLTLMNLYKNKASDTLLELYLMTQWCKAKDTWTKLTFMYKNTDYIHNSDLDDTVLQIRVPSAWLKSSTCFEAWTF